MNPLNPMDSAPKDQPILIDTGLGFLQIAHWNNLEECWVFAALNCNDGDGDDIYFETDYEQWPAGWLPLPAYTPDLATLADARERARTQARAKAAPPSEVFE